MAQTKRKKSEKRQRTNLKAFRLSDAELSIFVENCNASNLNGGDFFRQKCCDQKPLRRNAGKRMDHKVFAELIGRILQSQSRMARLDNNVNQLAKAANVALLNTNNSQLATIFERHTETLSQLLTLYKEYVDTSTECRDILRQKLLMR